ncbi:leucyl aminopeptidase family protein [Streptomyces sp. NPDC059479]|uniref:leucyl aminopeptidase family protein n=1 Tax=Streptomyces sp. NPDC059479 TaxID=3346848 RepID=UPI00369063DA
MTVVRAGEPHEPADVVARPCQSAADASPFARRRGFLARAGQVVAEPAADGRSVVLNVGLGPAGSATAAVFRQAAAAAVRAAGPARTVRLDLALTEGTGVPAADRVRAVTEGARLALYRYDAFRSTRGLPPSAEVRVTGEAPEALAEALAMAEGICLARDLVNSPPGVLTPAAFARRIEAAAAEAGLSCAVYGGPALARLRLAGLEAVSRGSAEPARYVELTHEPAEPPELTVALVGKGVTFDSGGLSLKPSGELHTMKADMGGAAAVLGALVALPRLGLPVRVRAHLPLAENMPDGGALRVGDVVRHLDGTTTEITHTDNEGRVILSDVLLRASRPRQTDLVLDVATLTSAAVHALGTRTGALFSPDDALADLVERAAERAGESLWRLPLLAHERRHLRSAVADRVNCSHRHGDTVQAALYLSEFLSPGTRWAHLDIAAPAWNDEPPYGEVPHGATGFGVRTLLETLRALAAPASTPT